MPMFKSEMFVQKTVMNDSGAGFTQTTKKLRERTRGAWVGSVIIHVLTSYRPIARVPYRKRIEEISTVSSFVSLGSLEINNLSE